MICLKEVTGSPSLVPTAYLRLVPHELAETALTLLLPLPSSQLGCSSAGLVSSARDQTRCSTRMEAGPSTNAMDSRKQQTARSAQLLQDMSP